MANNKKKENNKNSIMLLNPVSSYQGLNQYLKTKTITTIGLFNLTAMALVAIGMITPVTIFAENLITKKLPQLANTDPKPNITEPNVFTNNTENTLPSILPETMPANDKTSGKSDNGADDKILALNDKYDFGYDYLGLYIKTGLAVVLPFSETGLYRGQAGKKVTNNFTTSYGPTIALGYDFSRNSAVELNYVYFKTASQYHLSSPIQTDKINISNHLLTIDSVSKGIRLWRFSIPFVIGLGANFWTIENANKTNAATDVVVKAGTGINFNILDQVSIFSSLDIEARFDYYLTLGNRYNTNVNQGAELLLQKDFGAGSIGNFMLAIKMGF